MHESATKQNSGYETAQKYRTAVYTLMLGTSEGTNPR